MWTDPNGVVYRDARVKWSPPKGRATVRWQPRSALCGMFVKPIYFVSYYFYWIEYDAFFFHFQKTYNSWLRERYGDDPSTHSDFDSDLWMEVGSSGGPDKNQVYRLSNTPGDNLRAVRSVSTVGSSNLRSSWPCSNTRLISPKIWATIGELRTTHSSHRKLQATLGELWTTTPNDHEHYIIEGWYTCAPFLAVWSREQLASSSSSSPNSVIVLI